MSQIIINILTKIIINYENVALLVRFILLESTYYYNNLI